MEKEQGEVAAQVGTEVEKMFIHIKAELPRAGGASVGVCLAAAAPAAAVAPAVHRLAQKPELLPGYLHQTPAKGT